MTEVFTGLEYVDFDALSAGIALYRPGPMEHIPEYQDRANGLKPVEYPIPELKGILEESEGIAIYQEQIMLMAQQLGGYTPGQADTLRKATGRKSESVMNEVLPELRQAVLDNGYSEDVAEYMIRTIEPFVGYGLTL